MILKNFFCLALKYIKHNLNAKNKRGYGIHSPFVFDLCKNVFSKKFKGINEIENIRKQLIKSKRKITFVDVGAGSSIDSKKVRRISEIARFSSNKKVNKLLFKLIKHLKPSTVVEFGTSFGFSTMYMAMAYKRSRIITVEGVPEIADIARRNFQKLKVKNIRLIESGFDDFLNDLPGYLENKTIVYLDGNHRKEATLKYFNYIVKHISNDSVIVLDDISWSVGMSEAWQIIKKSEKVTLSIDLFFVGIVFLKKRIYKQSFKIRF